MRILRQSLPLYLTVSLPHCFTTSMGVYVAWNELRKRIELLLNITADHSQLCVISAAHQTIAINKHYLNNFLTSERFAPHKSQNHTYVRQLHHSHFFQRHDFLNSPSLTKQNIKQHLMLLKSSETPQKTYDPVDLSKSFDISLKFLWHKFYHIILLCPLI